MKRKVLSMLLSIAVCISMLPMTAYAVDGENTAEKAAIQLGTSGISDPTPVTVQSGAESEESKIYYEPNSYIYFGADDNKEPIKWRVLDADKANNGADGMFLLSEYLLASLKEFSSAGTSWQGCDAQNWCKQFLNVENSHFSSFERKAFLSVTKTDRQNSLYNDSWLQSSLDEDEMFLLSVSQPDAAAGRSR